MVNEVERVNSVIGVRVLGMIEKRVNGNEDTDSRPASSGIEIEDGKKKESLEQLEEISVKSAPGVRLTTAVKPASDARIEMKQEDTAEMQSAHKSEPEAKMDLHTDLERAGLERLAAIERLAEKERREKIRRREELDRLARLQRILALVRAPELDSVAIMQRVDITPTEEMTVLKELGVETEINPVLKIGKVEVKEAKEMKQLSEHKAAAEAEILARNKQITDSEGISKLERMSKLERISEIDRLVDLEHEAEVKRTAEIERVAELEREAELKRVAKMRRLAGIDLKAEMEEARKEKTEKERLEEKKRQENIRKREELERVAKLQRLLAMVLVDESDSAEETRAANLERVIEMKRRDELKLLEELGILPKDQVTKGKVIKPVGEEKLTATVAIGGINPVKEVNPVTEFKEEVDSVKVAKQITDVYQLKKVEVGVDVETIANLEQLPDTESETNIDMEAVAEKDPKIISTAVTANRRKADREIRKRKQNEELERVANLQRIIAMVLNPEVEQVAEMKQAAELEELAESKQKDEMKFLEELGILSKSQVTQQQVRLDEGLKQVAVLKLEEYMNLMEEIKPFTEIKEVPEVKVDVVIETVSDVEQLTKIPTETKTEMLQVAEREAKIKRAAEMERKANADREARIKRREELVRVANLQRVVAMVHDEEFDRVPEIKKEELKQIAEKKHREDMKVLEDIGIVTKEQELHQSVISKAVNEKTEIKPAKETNSGVDFKGETEMKPTQMELNIEERSPDRAAMSENERIALKRDVERRFTELRVAQMRRVADLGREMKNGIVVEEKQHGEFQHFTESKRPNKEEDERVLKRTDTKIKIVEELEPLAKTRLSELKQEAGAEFIMKGVEEAEVESETKRVEESKSADFELAKIKRDLEEETGMERKGELKPAEPRRVLKMKHETGLELMELKRLKEMERVVGIERVRGRDCEWDGQMMYVGKV